MCLFFGIFFGSFVTFHCKGVNLVSKFLLWLVKLYIKDFLAQLSTVLKLSPPFTTFLLFSYITIIFFLSNPIYFLLV